MDFDIHIVISYSTYYELLLSEVSAEAKCVVEKFGYTFIIEQGRIVKIKCPSDLQFLRLGRP